ncbi:MAG: hypothetical protein ACLSV7_06070 [Oscillospiraceae bacterium]
MIQESQQHSVKEERASALQTALAAECEDKGNEQATAFPIEK